MLPDRVSNPEPLTYESGALPIALHGPANTVERGHNSHNNMWLLAKFAIDLYLMIIYLCIKYESIKLIFSKDNEQKPFFGMYETTYIRTNIGDTVCPHF